MGTKQDAPSSDMNERPLRDKINGQQPPSRLTQKWVLLALLCLSLLFFVFACLGDPGRGRAAYISAALITIVASARWDLRDRAWFWLMLAIVVLVHAALVLLIPWTDRSYPGYSLLPVGVLDLGFVYVCIKLAEKIWGGTKLPQPPAACWPSGCPRVAATAKGAAPGGSGRLVSAVTSRERGCSQELGSRPDKEATLCRS